MTNVSGHTIRQMRISANLSAALLCKYIRLNKSTSDVNVDPGRLSRLENGYDTNQAILSYVYFHLVKLMDLKDRITAIAKLEGIPQEIVDSVLR